MPTIRDLLINQQRSNFTDREEIIGIISDLIQVPLPTRLYRFILIYGPGGIGKTVLMRKLQDLFNELDVPSTLANMDSINSPIDILTAFRENFEAISINNPFRDFDSLIIKFKEIQVRLHEQEMEKEKSSEIVSKVAGSVSSAVIGGAITGLALGPVGILIGAAGGALADSLMESSITDLLKKGVINSNQADFLINFLSNLVEAFVRCLDEFANARLGVVLVFDGFEYAEKSKHLIDWISDHLLPNLGENTFVIISGRNKPDNKFWQTYSSFSYQYRLPPFNNEDIKNYLDYRGVDSSQSNSLLNLTEGLPLGAALWTDIEIQKQSKMSMIVSEQHSTEVVITIVNRLLENMNSESKQIMRLCAVPRWFDEDILTLLRPQQEAIGIFEQLHRYSSLFRSETNGLVMHDEVRRYLLDDFKGRNLNVFRDVNQKMARYYEKLAKLESRYTSFWFKYRIEHAYHLLTAESAEGYALLTGIVDDAHAMRDSSILDDLLKIISGLPDNQKYYWTTYLEGEIHFLHQNYENAKTRFVEASKLRLPQMILCRVFISLSQTLWNFNEHISALDYSKKALKISQSNGDYRGVAWLYTHMGWINHDMGNLNEATRLQKIGLSLVEKLPDKPDLGWALNGLGTMYLDRGNINIAEELLRRSIEIWTELGHNGLKFFPLFHLGEACSETGRYALAIDYYQSALKTLPGNDDEIQVLIRLGEAMVMEGKLDHGIELLKKCYKYAQDKSKPIYEARALLFLGNAYLQQLLYNKARICFNRVIDITTRIRAFALKANALKGVTQLCYQEDLHLSEFLNAVDELENISRKYEYHRQLSIAFLYQGLKNLRTLFIATQNKKISDSQLETITPFFYNALAEAIQFNSFILDKILEKIITELMDINVDSARRIIRRLAKLWSVGKLGNEQILEFETERRKRDNFDNHKISIITFINNTLL